MEKMGFDFPRELQRRREDADLERLWEDVWKLVEKLRIMEELLAADSSEAVKFGLEAMQRRIAAIEGADIVHAAQAVNAGGKIARIKVIPIGKKAEMDAYDPFRRHDAPIVLAAVHELQAVEASEGGQQIAPIRKSVQVFLIGGQIECALHRSTLSRSVTLVNDSPFGPTSA